ncbi:MAG: lysozyme family protein [Aerococcaceae bacterium]|nr:lysozyme family protein [Aerococcaceae bacterium]
MSKQVIRWLCNMLLALMFGTFFVQFFILIVVVIGLSTNEPQTYDAYRPTIDLVGIDLSQTRLSALTLSWADEIKAEMVKQNVPEEYLIVLLGILQNESGGGGVTDIFQASESRGWSMNDSRMTSELMSIEVGVEHFKNTLEKAQKHNKSVLAAVAGYNYGHAFLDYLNKEDKDWTIEIAEAYSKEVVAPSLGNTTGKQYPYVNEVSTSYNMPYAYWNGGNFHYVPMFLWYLGYDLDEIQTIAKAGSSDLLSSSSSKTTRFLFNKFENEAIPNGDLVAIAKSQIGLPYSWGGGGKEGPSTGINDPAVQDASNIVGFDCSGFMQYIYWQAYKVDIGDWSVPQESSGHLVEKSDLKVGDLLFWGNRGSTYHVAMYIGNNQLIESSTPGNPIDIHPMRGFDFAVRPDVAHLKSQQK